MLHLLRGGALARVLIQQRSHKVFGFCADAIPGLPLKVHLIAEDGLPAVRIVL